MTGRTTTTRSPFCSTVIRSSSKRCDPVADDGEDDLVALEEVARALPELGGRDVALDDLGAPARFEQVLDEVTGGGRPIARPSMRPADSDVGITASAPLCRTTSMFWLSRTDATIAAVGLRRRAVSVTRPRCRRGRAPR